MQISARFFVFVALGTFSFFTSIAPLAQAAPKENAPFVDIAADDPFTAAIAFLKSKSVVKGYPDQTFHPDRSVSRAEFTKMTLALNGRSLDAAMLAKMMSPFADVSKNDWFFVPVFTASKLGFVQGYVQTNSAGKKEMMFAPQATITRAQALKVAFEGLQFEKFTGSGFINQAAAQAQTQSIPLDVSGKAWYAAYVHAARKLHILTESNDGHFAPDSVVTRGMAAELLYRMWTVANAKGATFDLTNEWSVSSSDSFTLRLPQAWSARSENSRVDVFHRDPLSPSPDPELMTPFSAYMRFETNAPDAGVNAISSSSGTYFSSLKALLKSNFSGKDLRFTELTLLGKPALHTVISGTGEERWYIFYTPSLIVKVQARYGLGAAMLRLRDTVRDIVRTMQYGANGGTTGNSASGGELAKKTAAVNQNILVEHVGKATIDGVGDAILLETDSIGVGTGPVDYYFSALLNMTLKYERSSDTILSVRTEKTTAF